MTTPPSDRPGRWVRAHHMTDLGIYEIRERPDGRYDVREPYLDEPSVRGVSDDYVRAEFCTDLACQITKMVQR